MNAKHLGVPLGLTVAVVLVVATASPALLVTGCQNPATSGETPARETGQAQDDESDTDEDDPPGENEEQAGAANDAAGDENEAADSDNASSGNESSDDDAAPPDSEGDEGDAPGSDDGGSETEPEPPPPPVTKLRGSIVVNELLPDPNGDTNVDTDGNGEAVTTDEFVELYNGGTDPVDISGLELWDPSGADWFVIPPDSILEPRGVALIVVRVSDGGSLPSVASGSLAFDAGYSRGVINNGGDNVIVLDPTEGTYIRVLYNGEEPIEPELALAEDGFPADASAAGDAEDWGSDTDGASLAREIDGSGAPVPHTELGTPASPGQPNAP